MLALVSNPGDGFERERLPVQLKGTTFDRGRIEPRFEKRMLNIRKLQTNIHTTS